MRLYMVTQQPVYIAFRHGNIQKLSSPGYVARRQAAMRPCSVKDSLSYTRTMRLVPHQILRALVSRSREVIAYSPSTTT